LVEVRGFEPRTPCMPCRLFQFGDVHLRSHVLASLVFESANVYL
jgi:hypothetical protein